MAQNRTGGTTGSNQYGPKGTAKRKERSAVPPPDRRNLKNAAGAVAGADRPAVDEDALAEAQARTVKRHAEQGYPVFEAGQRVIVAGQWAGTVVRVGAWGRIEVERDNGERNYWNAVGLEAADENPQEPGSGN